MYDASICAPSYYTVEVIKIISMMLFKINSLYRLHSYRSDTNGAHLPLRYYWWSLLTVTVYAKAVCTLICDVIWYIYLIWDYMYDT